MSEYQRHSRECTLETMPPALASALRSHAEKRALGDLFSQALICCETTSIREKKTLFKRQKEQTVMVVLLTPHWLIWATQLEDKQPATLSARLLDLHVQDYEQSEVFKLVPDSGLTISGLRTGETAVGSAFLGLGPEPAAQKFREKLQEALAKASG